MRVSILGAGGWGQNLVRVFCELLGDENVLVCDPREARRTAMKREHPGIRVSERPVFEGVEAVVIAAPTVAHAELARAALSAGRHVLVEKPIALTTRDAEDLVLLAKERNTILMVDHLLEYHPAVRKLKRLVDEGRLGRILHLSSERLNLGIIRTEENALWSLAPHDISVILYLLGEEPFEVAAHGAAYLQPGIEDVAFVTLRFASGALGHVHASWLDPVRTRRLTVVGDERMAVFDDGQKVPQLFLYDARATRVEGAWRPHRGEAEAILIPQEEPLRTMAATFLESIKTGIAPQSDGKEGLRVVRVLEAAERSMKGGGKLVETKSGEEKRFFVHESSYVDEGVTIGRGAKIWHFSHIMRGTTIGEGTSVGQNVLIGPNVTVGKNVKIQNNVSAYEGVTLEDDVFCGPSCVFTNVDRPRSASPTDHAKYGKTVIKRGATIGANATIVCGHSLGEHAFVGAGSVVTKDVPAYAIVYGNPARLHGWACQCGQPLEFAKDRSTCSACGRCYKKEGESVSFLKEAK